MKRRFTPVFLLFSLLLFYSCGDPTAPEDILEEDRYISVFTELVVINQLDDEQLDGVSRDYLKEQVLEEYNITQEQFELSHQYYQQQPDQQIQRLDKIEESLKEERDVLQDRLNRDRKRLTDSLAVSDTLSPPNDEEEITNND